MLLAAGGTPARASLTHAVAVRSYPLRDTPGSDVALSMLSTRSSISVLFTAAAWSRRFTNLAASGLSLFHTSSQSFEWLLLLLLPCMSLLGLTTG